MVRYNAQACRINEKHRRNKIIRRLKTLGQNKEYRIYYINNLVQNTADFVFAVALALHALDCIEVNKN
jgi:hypothetical protein